MWSAYRNDTMNSPALSVASGRPWTPPDTDSDYYARSSSPGSFSGASENSASPQKSAPTKPTSSPHEPFLAVKPTRTRPIDANTHNRTIDFSSDLPLHHRPAAPRPHDALHRYPTAPEAGAHLSTSPYHSDPHTPVKPVRIPDPQAHHAMPSYPYTPESARTGRAQFPRSLSPLPFMPWGSNSESSPVQGAIHSCVSHLEDLIATRQPNETQMEYLVSKLEEMAQYLSAPEAQSRQSDDHLFSDLEGPSGLGILNVEAGHEDHANDVALGASYILQVDKYIKDVKKQTEDMQMRMDEVKTLNSIQLEIIADLRQQVQFQTRSTVVEKQPVEEKPVQKVAEYLPKQQNKRQPAQSSRLTQSTSFWGSIWEALDEIGTLMNEW